MTHFFEYGGQLYKVEGPGTAHIYAPIGRWTEATDHESVVHSGEEISEPAARKLKLHLDDEFRQLSQPMNLPPDDIDDQASQ